VIEDFTPARAARDVSGVVKNGLSAE